MQEFQSDRTTVLIGSRQAGKTTALIEWAKADPARIIICPTESRAAGLRSQGHAAGLRREQVISSGSAVQHLRGKATGGVIAVDDLLDYVYADLGVMPAYVTLAGVPVAPEIAETPAQLKAEAVQFITDENARLRTLNAALLEIAQTNAGISCDGRCLTGSDLGVPSNGIAYPDPECSLHGDETTQLEALRAAIAAVSS
jgi:hypothetical protein